MIFSANSLHCFVSYAGVDRGRPPRVVVTLEEAGITDWIDRNDIEGGANHGVHIAEAIEGCSAFILMSSSESLASRNVRQEIVGAWKYYRPYLRVLGVPVQLGVQVRQLYCDNPDSPLPTVVEHRADVTPRASPRCYGSLGSAWAVKLEHAWLAVDRLQCGLSRSTASIP